MAVTSKPPVYNFYLLFYYFVKSNAGSTLNRLPSLNSIRWPVYQRANITKIRRDGFVEIFAIKATPGHYATLVLFEEVMMSLNLQEQ